jgi:hypothetical protein
MFGERMKAVSALQVVAVSTLLSMLLPTSYYGMNALSDRKHSRGGWGDMPAQEVFFVTSLLILPVLVVFPADDKLLRAAQISRQASLLPFFFLWWVHGGINACHVHMLARDAPDET